MDSLAQDLRYAVRQLVRSPGFTLVTLLTLGIGIGINAAAFSLVSAVLYRPLPVHEPDRLVRIWTSEWERSGIPTRFFGSSSWHDFVDLRAGLDDVVTGLAAYSTAGVSLAGDDDAPRPIAAFVSDDFFAVLGVQPSRGRLMSTDETRPGATANVAVITNGMWRTRLGGREDVLGSSLTLAGEAFTVVGVVPDEPLAPLQDAGVDVVLPLAAYPRLFSAPGLLENRTNRWLGILGRMRPGMTVEQTQAALAAAGRRIGAEFPAESGDRAYTLGSASTLVGFAGESRSEIRMLALVLMSVAGIVLLIAGANLANLLLARAARRGREIAIRLSLGAARRRIVRQLLTESVLLSLAGGVLAVVLALWVSDLFRLLPIPAGVDPRVDARVLAFTGVIAIATGMLFGLAPALRGTRAQPAHVIQHEGSRSIAGGRSRLRSSLVAAQIALSFVLLVAAGLLGRSVLALRDADPGFDAGRVLTASISLDRRRYEPRAARAMYDRILERAAALPGVQSASLSSKLAFSGGRSRMAIEIPGYEPGPGESSELEVAMVSPDWLNTMGIPLVRGRGLDDAAHETRALLINEAMARRYWPGSDPIGATFQFGTGAGQPQWTVVGVARDAQLDRLTRDVTPLIIRPLPPEASSLVLHLRTDGDPAMLADNLRVALRALDPDLPVRAVRPLDRLMAERSQPTRLAAGSMALSGALALLLATIGLYGVMAFLVAQRVPEIGIRMALGAEQGRVLRLILGDGIRVAAAGVGIGAVLALAATRALGSTLYGIAPWDPITFAGIAALLLLVASAASWVPARRASAVDPAIALRTD